MLNVGTSRIFISCGERVEHLAQRNVVGQQFHRIDLDLVLLGSTTKTHDIHHSRHGAELTFDHPVLQSAHFRQGHALWGIERVTVNFSHRCRIRGKSCVRIRRQADAGE